MAITAIAGDVRIDAGPAPDQAQGPTSCLKAIAIATGRQSRSISLAKQEGTVPMLEPNGSAVPLTAANGRPIKFTPERLQQIKNLVERGLSREQIAETIGVTLGSLQVTCSRLGISLRRPRPSNGLPPQQSSDEPTMPEHRAKFALQMQYRGRERIIELPLSRDLLGRLAIESHFHNLSVGEMAVKLITAAVKADLFEVQP
jgi:transposase